MQPTLLHSTALLALLTSVLHAQANWNRLTPRTNPAARSDHVLVGELTSLFVFGGRTGTTWLADTWRYRAGQWTQLKPSANPGPLAHAAGTWDSARGVPLIFGGRKTNGTGSLSAETWEFTGGNWVRQMPSNSPTARIDAAMVFDARLRRAVMFGGRDSKPLDDLWTYRGGVWSIWKLLQHPAARYGHGLAYDRDKQDILMFGGRDASGALRDTWVLRAGAWLRVGRTNPPPARWGHSLAYDNGRERYVLFGGTDGTKTFGDTWEFDGTNWILRRPKVMPSARHGFEHRFLLAAGHVAGFGGESGGGVFRNDTWLYVNPNPARFSTFGAGCAGPSGTPTIVGSLPWLGERFTLTILFLPPLAPTFLNIGFSRTTWGRFSLPFDLKVVGAPGCLILVDPLLTLSVVNSQGRPSLNLLVPNDPRVIGMTVYQQAFVHAPKANRLGVAVSGGGAAQIGAK